MEYVQYIIIGLLLILFISIFIYLIKIYYQRKNIKKNIYRRKNRNIGRLNMEEKLISIIVTVYNREDYLDECLSSIQNQTYTNFEAIIVDDGSTDNSLAIAQKYQEEDNRFKLIASKHVGFPEAKNIGLRNTQGDYIIFLDSDDSAYPDWLKLLYEASQFTDADITVCFYDEYREGNEKALEPDMSQYYGIGLPIAEFQFLKMSLLFQYGCASYMWNKLIKKELYKEIQFVDQIALSDISTMYKIFDKANKVVQVYLPLVHYRRHMDSMGAQSGKLGLEYYIFRMKIIKEVVTFVWEKYPQTRRNIQLLLDRELKKALNKISEEEFLQFIFLEEFQQMLQAPTPIFVNKM